MDLEEIKTAAIVLTLGWSIVNSYANWRMWHNNETEKRIALLVEKVEGLDREVAALEAVTRAAPTHGDLAKIYDAFNVHAAKLNTLIGENKEQSNMLHMIIHHMTAKA